MPYHWARKLCFLVFFIFCNFPSHADISSVGYIHATILSEKNITVPVAAGVSSNHIASVHYLMQTIDAANAILNGRPTTDYANDPMYSIPNPVAHTKAMQDIDTLIVKDVPDYFIARTIPGVTSLGFWLTAPGTYYLDCGEGQAIRTINYAHSEDSSSEYYGCGWSGYGVHELKLTGRATSYLTTSAAISFHSNQYLASIEGSLGAIFPTIGAQQPKFQHTFFDCKNLSGEIPPDLFTGITGAPTTGMFSGTFSRCKNLTGAIPSKLFSGLSGAPAPSTFYGTFRDCTGLTKIPADLFSSMSGPPANGMFDTTFMGCTGLTKIPSGLFKTISGPTAPYMFQGTFSGCTGLTGNVPSELFGKYTGHIAGFNSTFGGCTGLTGIEDGIWDISATTGSFEDSFLDAFIGMFYGCTNITSASPSLAKGSNIKLWQKFGLPKYNSYVFFNCTKMADYNQIPWEWKADYEYVEEPDPEEEY